jgi:excisionase family DNA binding protein
MPMTKQEAAEFLGVSVRTVEGYVERGKLTSRLVTGVRGRVSVFDEAELQKIKDERGEVVYSSPPGIDNSRRTSPSQALQTRQSVALGQMLLDALQGLQTQGKGIPARVSLADLSHKLMLSLPEAAQLSGVPVEELRRAAKAGKLRMVSTAGRGFGKVKRTELESYVRKL